MTDATRLSATEPAVRSCSTPAASGWTATPPPDDSVTTMLDAGVDLRDVQIAARHADPSRWPQEDIDNRAQRTQQCRHRTMRR
jgi:hypothetical protein